MVSRRGVLALGGWTSTAVLAGCSGFGTETERLTLELLNFDSEPHTVAVELRRTDADEYSEAVVFRDRFELETPPEDDAASQHREPDVIESDEYQVRVHLEDAPATRETYRYYPDCADHEGAADRLLVEVRAERESGDRYLQFQQNVCSGSSG
ncbi:hypothetical protein [Natrinema altunense]|uniref:Lipoprotein n=1 Tax=Natrinema altunense (strain JCM 12890 / CGMCC 1.3731 / AJ2) TaxID=1227494 RepID=L9ZXW1_NATA2|nr:hypothetical protein [Natrinema altunense]ELY91144.1 hypothetical protein C485_02044 [Natrinema altunense JCM 12890]